MDRDDPYGVIFFNLEKLAPVVALGNIDVYAAMKGVSVPEFQNPEDEERRDQLLG